MTETSKLLKVDIQNFVKKKKKREIREKPDRGSRIYSPPGLRVYRILSHLSNKRRNMPESRMDFDSEKHIYVELGF